MSYADPTASMESHPEMTTFPIASVVIPAHNESAVIGHTLETLLEGASPTEFEVVVVANACRDDTAQIASRTGVRVIDTPIAGKTHAVRLGDEACSTFPRVYLDADISLTAESVRKLVAAVSRDRALAAAPQPQWDLGQATWVMRRVHRVHDVLVAPSRGLAGVGVYVLSEAGHARAFPVPDIVCDDEWVERSFDPTERVVVTSAWSVVRPATNVKDHLRRRVRVRRGNRQLDALGKAARHDHLSVASLYRAVARRDATAVAAGCYLGVMTLDRLITRAQKSTEIAWASDASSRSGSDQRCGKGQDTTVISRTLR
jgi:glycosyltransferase involved in cell wall biosynthesis